MAASTPPAEFALDLEDPGVQSYVQDLLQGYLSSFTIAVDSTPKHLRGPKVRAVTDAATKDVLKTFTFTPAVPAPPSFANVKVSSPCAILKT
jgi:hypothetical protein